MKLYFKPLLTLATIVLPFCLTAAAQSKDFKKTVDLEQGGSLSLSTDKGSVRLSSWSQNQVEIVARIDPPDEVSPDYARRAIEGVVIEVLGGGRSLTIRSNFEGVPYREDFGGRSRTLPNVHYEIRAPRSLKLNVDIDRSRVDLNGFEGSIEIHSDRTPVTATDIAGDIRLRMDRGELTLSKVRGALNVDTDRTDINLQGVRFEGDSRFDMDRGELDIKLAESQGLSIQTDLSRRGDFTTDLQISMQNMRGKNFDGTINGGGPRVVFRTDRGRIRLRRE
ncbi:MAG TPA: DUF4097 family beta strand repeat-containing protein [Blastocatellia bacterium]|nr:DUF4097 family beta strand repeat-containing protein [Blastocatellia bacterium]